MWKALITFNFPSLVDLQVVVTIGNESLVIQSDHYGSHDYTLLSFLLMRPSPALPCLETLDAEVRPLRTTEDGSSTSLLLPHSIFPPSLKHITLRCSFALLLSSTIAGQLEEELLSKVLFDATARVPPTDFKLQTLTFDLPGVGGVVKWAHGLALKMDLETHYRWDKFQDLVVKDQG